MDIIHLSSRKSLSGVERFVEDLSLSQNAAGHSVSIIISKSSELDSYAERLTVKGVKVRRMICRFNLPGLEDLYRFTKTILQVDIVHVHQDWHGSNMIVLPIIYIIRRGRGIVVTDHIRPLKHLTVLKKMVRRFVKCPHIAVSKSIKDSLPTFAGLNSEKIRIITTGIDINYVVESSMVVRDILKELICFGEGALSVGFVGRLVAQKNVMSLLKAVLALLEEDKLKLNLHIVGDGPEKELLKAFVIDHLMDDCVFFHGEVGNPFYLVKRIDVICLPSFYEGTPLCVLEALALGTPCVTTPTDGLVELKEQISEGLYLTSGTDDESIYLALKYFFQKKGSNMGKPRKTLLSNGKYEISHIRDQIFKEYTHAMEG